MSRGMMRLWVLGASLVARPVFAQTPPAQIPTPPQTPASQPAPLLTAPPPSAARPAVPFPMEARVAFVNMQTIFGDSNLGKRDKAKLQTLNDQLSAGLAAREKEIQGLADRIRTQTGIVSSQLSVTWTKDLQRLQREAQFAQQEAQVQVEQLQQELLSEFQTVVQPVIEAVRAEKGLWIVFSVDLDSNGVSIAAAHPGVDLSAEVVKRLNTGK